MIKRAAPLKPKKSLGKGSSAKKSPKVKATRTPARSGASATAAPAKAVAGSPIVKPLPPQPPRLVIVGRPNVGKSTLFNRLFGRRRALVHDEPGVTRDRIEEHAEWIVQGKRMPIILVDTGGLGGDRFADEIARQVELALKRADIVIALFDAEAGLTPGDEEVLRQLKRSGLASKKPLLGVVNKVDDHSHEVRIADFMSLRLDPILTISAEHGRGIDDLKDSVYQLLSQSMHERDLLLLDEIAEEFEGSSEADGTDEEPDDDSDESGSVEGSGEEGTHSDAGVDEDFGEYEVEEEVPLSIPKIPRIAIVGRPNAGKSTLVNALIREERMITSPIAGTTVDAVDSRANIGGRPYVLIDTAGIRRKSKTNRGIEVLSVVQAQKALERCDVAVLMLDGENGITDQDEKISGLIEEAGCGVILAVNKWDTQSRNHGFTREVAAELVRKKMGYLKYAPILFMSAKRGQGVSQIADLVDEILEQRRVKVTTHEFTEWVRAESEIHNPMNAKFYLCHQSGRNPPTFVCHVSDPKKVHFSLKRHLVNAIRERWGYMGNPVRLVFVEGKAGRNAKGRR